MFIMSIKAVLALVSPPRHQHLRCFHLYIVSLYYFTSLTPSHRIHVRQVKGITGPNRGYVGTLINIDEGDGIVKLDADSALKIISLNQLAKYVPRH